MSTIGQSEGITQNRGIALFRVNMIPMAIKQGIKVLLPNVQELLTGRIRLR